ncbi:putative quinol monooxygenase [Blastococcus sp. TF02A_35]|uniref:putative quinol monooxygenase n=1 Tax=Blastococcus sp. TF02A-35 TaxID=2559612 RepID=UPI001073E742|nr:putative quinol monooxygenase [Blastococcus sp. TF02A_35]TFV53047.1 antibiotic biosynthesis monooxygenase [Blastococcus sp. TF02A_35]
MSVVVIATITPRPDAVDAVREAVLAAVPQVHAEPGCERYALHEGEGFFVMVERWESVEALRVHGKAEALTNLGAAIGDKLAAPLDVRYLEAIPAGDPAKGAI